MEKKRILAMLMALCLVLVFVPVNRAAAADYAEGVWLRQIPYGDGVTIAVCADAQVAGGVITITYNKDVLTFQQLKLEEQYVLSHAINDQEAGIIQISWIGTGAESKTDGYVLMWLEFVGPADLGAVMTGSVFGMPGNILPIHTLNLTGITAAIMQAEALQAESYTADSFAAVRAALKNAEELQNQVAVTQAQLDAAAETLTAAMENLVVYTPDPEPTDPPATEPQPTDPPATEPQPTESQPTESKPVETKPTEPAATQPADQKPQDEDNMMLIPILVGCCVPIVVALVLLKKRGQK